MTVRLKPDADLDATTGRLDDRRSSRSATDGYDVDGLGAAGSARGGLNVIVTGQTAADVDKATIADRRRRSPTSRTSPTSRATSSRRRPRSRSRSTRTRRSRSG